VSSVQGKVKIGPIQPPGDMLIFCMHVELLPEPKMKAETRAKLRTTSTATITTALYKRGFRNQMIQGLTPVGVGKAEAMVGPAYTLR
jgi:hypothetical protein